MKKIVQLVVSLTVISGVCAAVLATVNKVTKEQIATIMVRAEMNAAKVVMPSSVKAVEKVSDAAGDYFVGKDAGGKVIAYALKGVSHAGYGGDIVLMIGFLPSRTVVAYQKLEAAETPGLGTNLTSPDFMKQFNGIDAAKPLSVKKDGGRIEAITSATITSRAVCEAINVASARLAALSAK